MAEYPNYESVNPYYSTPVDDNRFCCCDFFYLYEYFTKN